MSLLDLHSKVRKKKRKLLGRGNASGHGTFCCRGGKGQTARSGGNIRPGFEGGQTPFIRKMPKLKGFKNPSRVNYQVVNIEELNAFENNSKVTIEDLFKKNLIAKKNSPVKLLGDGEIKKAIEITVNKASKSAIEKMTAQKGKVNLIVEKEEKKEEDIKKPGKKATKKIEAKANARQEKKAKK
ncbi:MAG: 50S ribosomal protein L15 [Candidatus Gracilibacteria bacterium]|jgi:large subunit ribosomal protein L15